MDVFHVARSKSHARERISANPVQSLREGSIETDTRDVDL